MPKLEETLFITKKQLQTAMSIQTDAYSDGNSTRFLQSYMVGENLCVEFITQIYRIVPILDDGLSLSTIIEIKQDGTYTSRSLLVK